MSHPLRRRSASPCQITRGSISSPGLVRSGRLAATNERFLPTLSTTTAAFGNRRGSGLCATLSTEDGDLPPDGSMSEGKSSKPFIPSPKLMNASTRALMNRRTFTSTSWQQSASPPGTAQRPPPLPGRSGETSEFSSTTVSTQVAGRGRHHEAGESMVPGSRSTSAGSSRAASVCSQNGGSRSPRHIRGLGRRAGSAPGACLKRPSSCRSSSRPKRVTFAQDCKTAPPASIASIITLCRGTSDESVRIDSVTDFDEAHAGNHDQGDMKMSASIGQLPTLRDAQSGVRGRRSSTCSS